MEEIQRVRNQIADYWDRKMPNPRTLFATDDAYAAFYNSKYLIQDTSESIWCHMRKGFSSDPMMAYLEFWGVMQALIIQQDAIREIHECLVGSKPTILSPSPWFEIRDLRNRCAGHPAKKGVRDGHVRTFMGRNFGHYDRLNYEQFDTSSGKITHPVVNLRKLIKNYDKQAANFLLVALKEFRRKCP